MSKIFYILILGAIILGSINCSTKKNIKQKEMTIEEKEEQAYLKKMEKLEKEEQEFLSQMENQMKSQFDKMPYFPAEIKKGENFYAVEITAAVGAFYANEFRKHDLYANGYCWEGILEQIITKEQKNLLTNLNFDAEADTCFISCKDEKSMKELAEFIHHHFTDKNKFNEVIQKIDKSKLDC